MDGEPVAFCHTCKDDPNALEHVYHTECCEDVHTADQSHESETVDWKSSGESSIEDLFLSSSKTTLLRFKSKTHTEDEQKADVLVDALQLLEVQLPN